MPRAALPFAPAGIAAPRPGPGPGLLARLLAFAAMRRSRRSLAALDGRLLRDVGLSREEAREEARRPCWETVWDAPAHWLR